MPGYEVFVIRPSSYISGLCYSVLRLEPYSACSFGCIYCYARWYRRRSPGLLVRESLKLWPRVARAASGMYPRPFFRLATLSDPLQHAERGAAASLYMLSVASRMGVPIILNTKSTMLVEDPWVSVVKDMASRGLLLVQVSVSVTDKYSAVLEPGAPPTSSRLQAIERLAGLGVPVVARIQPLIPGLEEEHLAVAEDALAAGASGLIGESLRATSEDLQRISRITPLETAEELWEPYQLHAAPGRQGLLHPARRWRLAIHEELGALARSYGAAYTACKEGLPPPPGTDCCQASIHLSTPVMLRPTLYELVSTGASTPEEVCRRLGGQYVCSYTLRGVFRRWLRLHEARLRRLAASRQHVEALLLREGWV